EIPQEIGDFGVLIHAGFNKTKALILNYLVALTVVVGAVVGYILGSYMQTLMPYLLPIGAGGFIYIAASDLIPEIRKEKSIKKSLLHLIIFIIGIVIMYLVKFIK
ncbi:MAG: ZIP family metal transporter, partial [Candidatus Pacebacteria bacterium]|nr:ZIP family metal transporter [Candidatus Paceibacterota bacterium]